MTMTDAVETISRDATQLHLSALEKLEAGDIRDAAEKAWCAVKRAADALIWMRTGTLLPRTPLTTRMLRELRLEDPGVQRLLDGYYANRDALHGDCFYTGLCEPLEDTERLIRETSLSIIEAEKLAGVVLGSANRIFHPPDCQMVRPKPDVAGWNWRPLNWTWFASAEEALEAGYTLCNDP